MKYKNVAALLAAAMMALTLLAGCAKGGAENALDLTEVNAIVQENGCKTGDGYGTFFQSQAEKSVKSGCTLSVPARKRVSGSGRQSTFTGSKRRVYDKRSGNGESDFKILNCNSG